ncbi:RidA family protein [Sulfitobacter geojensis]|uniref:RidA family protein n=1 Tax=Sulfitobacter geojensis TaxID=1342299 RepID=UPI00056C2287|nr:RidA family protein [Sulfitobacter geojensis]KHA54092.1 hypothetical protein Z947_121 [Sulfitobacter geojensis]NYI29910.1 enamine deaminase RidA (YjgF/YER057c/UK114 family) [Sulfitobacter geojensis]
MTKNQAPQVIQPENVPVPNEPYSTAVKAGGWLFVSGQTATDFSDSIAPQATSVNSNLSNDQKQQSLYIMEKIDRIAKAADMNIGKDGVRIWQWFVSPKPTHDDFRVGDTKTGLRITEYLESRNLYVKEPRPASTAMGTKDHLIPNALLQVDVMLKEDGESVGTPAPDGVPAPLAGYSPAIKRGDFVFLSGEIPVDWVGDFGSDKHYGPRSALAKEARVNPYVWYGSEIEKQTDYTLWKLSKIAEAAGTTLDRAVKADVYIGDPADFEGMDRVWKKWFPENPPARVVVPWLGMGGSGARIEIAFVLLDGDSQLEAVPIHTDNAPTPFGHEPQAIKAGNLLFLSHLQCANQDGVVPENLSQSVEFPHAKPTARLQTREMMKHASAICEAGGTSLENVVRRACFLDTAANHAECMDEFAAHFDGIKPASTTMSLEGRQVAKGAHSILDLIAWVPE